MPAMPKPFLFRPRRARRKAPAARRLKLFLLVAAVILSFAAVRTAVYFRRLSDDMALSNAADLITSAVNRIVRQKMAEPGLDFGDLVELERDNDGKVTAIITNMARVNTLSAELLNAFVTASDAGELKLRIPLGSLLGYGLFWDRGPEIPVQIAMLTSSRSGFRNELVTAGINQTKHQLMLELYVDINVLMPWEVLSTQVKVNVLIAETVIVGNVPNTYLNWENDHG